MTAAYHALRRREVFAVVDELDPAVRALVHEYDLGPVAAVSVRIADPEQMRVALEARRMAA